MAVPMTDARLATWSANFNALGVSAPTTYNLTAAQMSAYTPLHTSYLAAYNAARADGARSKALVQAKEDAKHALMTYARELYGFVQSALTVTNENKTLIGVAIRKSIPTPIPPPALAPLITILSVTGRTARFKLADAAFPSSKRKPANAEGAVVLSYVGANPPPANETGWKLEGQTGRSIVLVNFPNSVTPGTPCWVSAIWYNRRGEYSPATDPVRTFLQIGETVEAS